MKRRERSITRAVSFLLSYRLFFCIIASTILCGFILFSYFKFPLWGVAELVTTKIFFIVLVLNRLAAFIVDIGGRKKTMLISAGLLVLLAGVLVNYAYRFEGFAEIGVGGKFSRYISYEKGPLGKPPELFFAVDAIKGDPLYQDKGLSAEISHEGARIELSPGHYEQLAHKIEIGIVKADVALRFLVIDETGATVRSNFIMMNLHPQGSSDHFLIDPLPHRFYVSVTGKKDKPFKVRVLRGKIVVAHNDVEIGEQVHFDGLTLSVEERTKWVLVKIRHYPGNTIMITGMIIVVIGLILLVRTRK